MFHQFLADESGATAIEYAMILGLVALVLAGALGNLRNTLQNMYNFISSEVVNATSASTG